MHIQYLAGVRLVFKFVKSPAMQKYTDGVLRYNKGTSNFSGLMKYLVWIRMDT